MPSYRSLAFVLATLTLAAPALAAPKIEHVLLVSVDGLHGGDFDRYLKSHPASQLARLAAQGLVYSSAYTSAPSDSFPGLLSLVSGGRPRSTGVWYDEAYVREFSSRADCKPGAAPTGVVYDFSEAIDVDRDQRDTSIDPAKLPADPAANCAPVYPHQVPRVNTIFEVAHQAGLRTAWADKHPAYDLVQGPSGAGVDDLFVPEIYAGQADALPEKTIAYDAAKIDAVVNELKGFDHGGFVKVGVPAILGLNLQAVSVAQKQKGMGYLDASGSPSPGLADALDATDAGLGKLAATLKSEGLADSTLFIVTAKHGQSPIDPAILKIVDSKAIRRTIESVLPGSVGYVTSDDVALIWLKDKTKTDAATKALTDKLDELAIEKIYAGAELAATFADPAKDPRAPDLLIQPKPGVIYTKLTASKIAEHGGTSEEDRHVALAIFNPAFSAQTIAARVETVSVAPTILAALGLDPMALQGARDEGVGPLEETIAALRARP